MEVVILQVFVSLALVASSLLLFAFSAKQRDVEHASRLSLLPLEEDTGSPRPVPPKPTTPPKARIESNVVLQATRNG